MKKIILTVLISFIGFMGCSGVTDSDKNDTQTLSRELTSAEKQIVESVGTFSYALFRRTASRDRTKNIFISPLSASMALGMTLNGAAGKTREAMKETLRLQGMDIESINEAYASLIELLFNADSKVKMKLANSIWLRQGFDVRESFKEVGTSYFNARVEALDFTDPAAANIINQWVAENTGGLIESIIEGPIPREMVMYLINAIYFQGDWLYQFDERATAAKPFTPQEGDDVEVAMMLQENNLAAFVSEDVVLVDLPYGDSLFTMTLMMPADEDSMRNFIQSKLTEAHVNDWISKMTVRKTRIELPRFELSYEIRMNDILKAMGMSGAFSRGANFSNINPEAELYLSEVKQKAFLTVDEEGTEAGAATSVRVGVTSMPQIRVIKFNRPFVFMIRERTSDTILFIGKVVDPVH